ncbi:lipopolysaccharide biosynthesis protein [soil metagenome]
MVDKSGHESESQTSQWERVTVRARRSPFFNSMAVLFSGSAASAGIGFAATPILARLYSPAEFGVLGVFVAALTLFSVVATLRYDRAIPSAVDDRDAGLALLTALSAVVCTSLLCCLLVLSGALESIISGARGNQLLLAWALPVGMAATGTYDALSFWMVRRRDYRALSLTKASQGASMVGAQVGLGLVHVGAAGLVVGQIAGSSMGILRLGKKALELDRHALTMITVAELRATAIRYRRFPLLSSPAVLLDALTGALPTLFIAHRFGAVPAGVLTIVTRVVQAPLSLLSTNMSQIFFGELAALKRAQSDTMLDLFVRRFRQIIPMGMALVGGMLLVVPHVLPVLLGAKWGEATTYFLILSPAIFAGFISSPFGVGIDVLRRQDLHFLRDAVRAGILIAAVTFASWYDLSARDSIKAISAAGCLNGIVYLVVCWYGFADDPLRARAGDALV